VNLFGIPSDERVLQAPNRSQPGPTSVRPGWPLLPRLATVKKLIETVNPTAALGDEPLGYRGKGCRASPPLLRVSGV
jgi:hypothetical protein